MGWDAFAEKPDTTEDYQFTAEELAPFREAAARVKAKATYADGLLEQGGLDVSISGEMLKQATGQSVYDILPWEPEMVRTIAASANWDFEVDASETQFYWSAREFLDTCAKLGYGIRFSW